MKTGAKNKTRLVNAQGYTMDIVNAVVDCYDRNFRSVPKELIYMCDEIEDDKTLCDFVFGWVDANIEYKVDPEGEQWIKTPARLIEDGVGDCKSFSILICSILTEMGIDNMFRFVAYKGKEYQHVYPVAMIDGKEYPLDVVAFKQRGLACGSEIDYKKKYDRMNSTRISELSGVDNMSIKVTSDMSEAELIAESMSLVAMAQLRYSIYWKYQLLKEVVKRYQTSESDFKLACYRWLDEGSWNFRDYPDDKTYSYQVRLNNIESTVRARNIPNSGYAIDEEQFNSEAFQAQWRKLETDVFPYLNVYPNGENNLSVSQNLLKVGMNGLYLFIPDYYISKTQKEKKQNQKIFVEVLINNSAFTMVSALNFIYAGFLSMYKTTPQEVFNKMFGKKVDTSYVSYLAGCRVAGEDDDFCGQIEYNPNLSNYEVVQRAEVVSSSNLSSQIGDWINKSVSWFTDIWGTVTGNTSNNNYKKVTPFYGDSSTGTGWIILAGAVALGFFLFKRKRR